MASVRLIVLASLTTLVLAGTAAAEPMSAGAVLIRQPGTADAAPVAGAATLRVLARSGARVEQAALDASSGDPAFDAVALRSVWRWRYVPAFTGDSASAEWLLVRFVSLAAPRPRTMRAAAR